MITFLSSGRSHALAFCLILMACISGAANNALAAGNKIAQASVKPGQSQERRTEKIDLSAEQASLTLNGTIKGYETVDYLVNAHAGQILTISLQSSNLANYFNVIAPGADFAIFNGAMLGSSYTDKLSTAGTYAIRVYMMRNAAKRKETATYTLNVSLFE